jgi:DNA-binding transcriptional ArsR family regulator
VSWPTRPWTTCSTLSPTPLAATSCAARFGVAVLEQAGLVTKERRGREQLVRTDPDAVGVARRALDQLEAAWRGRVDRMSDLLAQVPTQERNPTRGHDG